MSQTQGHTLPATATIGDIFFRWADNKYFFCTTTNVWTDSPGFSNLLSGGDSAGLRAALSDETGSGVAVFATSPTLVTPVLGVAAATRIIASLGLQFTATARTATVAGATTGLIADGTSFVVVTSGDANHIIVLPTPTPGTIVWLANGATGYELRSSTPASVAINGGTGSAGESAIAADSLVCAICVTATAWKAFFLDPDGDVAKVEAAAN